MSKEQHDQEAAATRRVNYDKIWFRQAAELLNAHDFTGKRALDLSCGNAEFSEIMRDRFGLQVTCADYVDHYVQNARTKGFDAFRLDLEDSNLLDPDFLAEHKGQYDVVVLLEVIEHIFDTNELLAFVHSLLKPGGYILVSTPNIAFIGNRLYSLVTGNIPFGEGHHVRFFDDQRLRAFLYMAGFNSPAATHAHYVMMIPFQRICNARSHIPLWVGKGMAFALARTPLQRLLPPQIRNGGLVIMARRAEIAPMAMSWQRCEQMLASADASERPQLAARLKSARTIGYFKEHPRMTEFVDQLPV